MSLELAGLVTLVSLVAAIVLLLALGLARAQSGVSREIEQHEHIDHNHF
jgi:hypothetical protein